MASQTQAHKAYGAMLAAAPPPHLLHDGGVAPLLLQVLQLLRLPRRLLLQLAPRRRLQDLALLLLQLAPLLCEWRHQG